ncbi:MAG: hypothetical protein Q9223_001188, partial [Gallowayella weberi]
MARPPLLKPAARSLFSITFSNRGTTRSFHNTLCLAGSPLFNLGGLSTSREAQYLSKERGIPRTDFAPHLELIKSSEVEPYATRTDLPRTIQPEERPNAPRPESPEAHAVNAPTTTFKASDVLYMMKELQDKTSMLEKERATASSLRKERDRAEYRLRSCLLIVLGGTIYMIWNLTTAVEIRAEEITRDKSQAGSPSLVHDDSDQEGNGPRDGTDDGVMTPAAALSHIPQSEWDQLRRSVQLLLDTGLGREEKELPKEAPASRLK